MLLGSGMESMRDGEEKPRQPEIPGSQVPPQQQQQGVAAAGQDPFLRKVAVAVFFAGGAAVLLLLVILGVEVLLAAFAGLLLAVLLHAFSTVVERYTPLSYGWSLAAVIVGLLLFFGGLGWWLTPRITEQTSGLGAQIVGVALSSESYLNQFRWGRWTLDQLHERWERFAEMGDAGAGLALVSGWLGHLLVAFFVGLFAAADPKLYFRGITHLFPPRHRERIRLLLHEVAYTLRWWLIGQALAMLIIGVSVAILAWAFGLPLPIVLGIVVGLLGFIPYLGPILGAIPIALIAATEGAALLAYVMLAYTAVQTLEGYVLTPLIQHRMVYLPPVFTIIAQILAGTVLGLLGFILATPLAAVILVLTRFYRVDILGEREAEKDIKMAQAS